MEFGTRLSVKGPRPLTDAPEHAPAFTRRRFAIAVVAGLCVGALLLLFEPHFYSSSEPCHARIVALKNRAYASTVTKFVLAGCKLKALPTGLLALTKLKHLDLANNELDTAALEGLASLQQLEVLFLSGNTLASVPAAIGQLPKLRMLGLRHCHLVHVDGVQWPASLEWLILTDNALRSVGKLPVVMRKLMLANNQLTDFPANLADLKSLEVLRVANNRIPVDRLGAPAKVLPALKWYAAADNPAPWRNEALSRLQLSGDVTRIAKLGEGSSGVVWRATYQGKAVAFKEFREVVSSDGLVLSELNMQAVIHGHGTTVLQRFVGWRDGAQPCAAFEFGDPLSESLAQPPSFESCTRDVYAPGKQFDESAVLNVLRDVAKALSVLHGKGIAHGDLYGHNVRYTPSGAATLMDLGSAWRFAPDYAGAVQMLEMRAFVVMASELFARVTRRERVTEADVKAFLAADHKNASELLRWLNAKPL